jgi:ATP-binding cassette subfamily B protein
MLSLAWAADPRRSILAFALLGLRRVVDTLFALWLKLLLDGIGAANGPAVTLAAIGLATSIVGGAALAFAGERVRLALTERAQHLVERRLVRLVGSTPTLEIHETPDHLTQLEVLDAEAWEFGQVIPALIDLFSTGMGIVTTALLLLSVDPLLLLLPLFGLPEFWFSSKSGAMFALGNELAAEPSRRANHLFELATTAGPAKEIRLFRLREELLARFHATHREIRRIHRRVNVEGEALGLATRVVFLVGYVGALALVVERAIAGQTSIGAVGLTAVLAGQVVGIVSGTASFLQAATRSLTAASRYVYLEDVARRARQRVDRAVPAPSRLADGIRLEHVSYRYPGASVDALRDIDLLLPAGATVAVVGDNGAGKTTLVKLLAGLYLPAEGRITLDGVDLATLDPDAWRGRISAGFQDHARFEFVVRETVGIGNLSTLDDETAITGALERAGAADLIDALPAGLATQLGPNWPAGVDLSGGQWQKLALGRAMVRTGPLLLLLDEPTAALDAETEHRLFERWTAAAQQLRRTTGAVTVLVSHRFSTVRMADLIVVLDQGRVVEVGGHHELQSNRGLYARLFEIQARSYR